MTNTEIAHTFATIGKMLDLKGENPFRVRAYDRAAQTIASLTQDLGDLYGEGGIKGLQEIPGIGADLSLKIEELIKTGKLKYLDDLVAKVPAGLLDIMNIPGMGPKKTKFVWEEFQVTDSAALKKLVESGKLLKLKGWGEKSVQKIAEGLQTKESLSGRVPINEAQALAESLIADLQKFNLCSKLEFAGSLRRRRESIGDIDLLAATDKPEEMMDALAEHRMVKSIIGRGPTKISVVMKNGIQVDLRVLKKEIFGAALHYFTGSKQHNIRVRSMGIKKGLTISEYGVFKGTAENKGKLVACETEEDVFKAVGLPYIPPELREDRGEIDAALADALPALIEEKDLRGDLHMHSTFSDGAQSIADMARAAKAKGFEYMAITDHGSSMGMVKGLKKENIKEYLKLVEQARKEVPGIHILAGVEVDIQPDGSLYLPDAVLKQLDWVVASVHGKFNQTKEEMTERLLKALDNPYVKLLGHPTGRLLLKRPGIVFDVDKVFKKAVEKNIALELNASVERLDLDDVHCKRAKELGAVISIDCDAHHAKQLDYRFGIAQAKRGWLEKGDVLNSWKWEKVQKWIKKP